MSVASLTNFTVPLSTNQSASSQGLLMPKLKFRFRVTFLNFGVTQPSTELTKQVMDFKRPSVSFQPIEIPIYNSKVYLAGKPEWAEVTCQLRDDSGGEVAKRVGEQMQKQYDFFEQSSASSGIDYKFITLLEILDGGNGTNTPNILETWELYGCYLSTTDYNNVDYNTNDPVTIGLTIRYDNALQTPTGSGIGATLTRTLGTVITG
jgi:hypothetical protein